MTIAMLPWVENGAHYFALTSCISDLLKGSQCNMAYSTGAPTLFNTVSRDCHPQGFGSGGGLPSFCFTKQEHLVFLQPFYDNGFIKERFTNPKIVRKMI